MPDRQIKPPQIPRATDSTTAAAARDSSAPKQAKRKGISGEVLAFVLSLVWLVMLATAFRVLGLQGRQISDTLGLIVVVLAVFLPIALIWLAVLVLRAARDMRDESKRLHLTVESMRRGWIRDQQAAGLALKPTVEEKLDEIAAAQRNHETALAMFSTRRVPLGSRLPRPGSPGNARAEGDDDGEGDSTQPVLALDNPLSLVAPVETDDFIRALHFPEDESDTAGFEALRRAMQNHAAAELIRAAQDVLTTLSQEGIYMDDLRPDRARPEIWRAFAQGARGREVAALGGIRDRSCLALTYGRMRSDPEFRDSSHRFLRAFDRQFAVFEAQASDGDIARFAETRSARAFMLLGRVTRIFG
ncbi:hypothetical protein [Pararhodobacter oceanensis]|uniref:hypothetical protein n=1 Tax=Pararhodobacter oceanensis TaxID=2172121 RepID=UPI003A950528